MLHLLLTEENSELKNKSFPIPKEVRKMLQSTLNNYNGDKTVDGYKRLNNILSMDNISYREMKRIKNFFDNYIGTDKSAEFILNGGESMKNWVNATLNQARKAIEGFKDAKKSANMPNPNTNIERDRQTHKKNKPKTAKINVSNRNMLNNTTLTYESKKKTIRITEEQIKIVENILKNLFK